MAIPETPLSRVEQYAEAIYKKLSGGGGGADAEWMSQKRILADGSGPTAAEIVDFLVTSNGKASICRVVLSDEQEYTWPLFGFNGSNFYYGEQTEGSLTKNKNYVQIVPNTSQNKLTVTAKIDGGIVFPVSLQFGKVSISQFEP